MRRAPLDLGAFDLYKTSDTLVRLSYYLLLEQRT